MASTSPVCGICERGQKTRLANVWCLQCDEGLCGDCSEHHSTSKASKHHGKIPINDYIELPCYVQNIEQYCTLHKETYQLFCNDHSAPCCRSCISDVHRGCTRIEKIEQVTQNVKSSTIFTEIEENLYEIIENIQLLKTEQQKNLNAIRNEKAKINHIIDETRKRINKHLDKLQEDVIDVVNKVEQKEYEKFKSVLSKLSDKETDSSKCLKSISDIKRYATDLQVFLVISRYTKVVDEITHFIRSLAKSDDTDKASINFEIEQSLAGIITLEKYGEIKIERRASSVTLINRKERGAQLNIPPLSTGSIDTIIPKLMGTIDTKGKDICGCFLMPNERMGFGCNYESAVFVFKPNGKRHFKLNMNVFDLSYSENTDTLYVSSGSDQKQKFNEISLSNGMNKSLDSDTYNYGVVFRNDSLFYCAGCKGICKRDLITGSVKMIVEENLPWNCYITEFRDKIYFTNTGKNTVTCCNIDGQHMWKSTIHGVEYIQGISVDNTGNVYVVCRNTHKMVVISPDGKRQREILSSEDGLKSPRAIHFQRSTNQLLVANKAEKAFLFSVNNS